MAHLAWEQRKQRTLPFWTLCPVSFPRFLPGIKLGEQTLRAEEGRKWITSLKWLALLWKHVRSIKHGGIHHHNGKKTIISFHMTNPYSFLFRGQWRSWHWPPLAIVVDNWGGDSDPWGTPAAPPLSRAPPSLVTPAERQLSPSQRPTGPSRAHEYSRDPPLGRGPRRTLVHQVQDAKALVTLHRAPVQGASPQLCTER